jgi:hypothetical protein
MTKLARLVDARGELVAAATPAQLTAMLDHDLWRQAQPGRDEQFDVECFGEWLEVLVDTGDSVAARTVATLDRHLVILGLSGYLRVFDPGTFEPVSQSDDEPIERHDLMNSETSRDVLECEIGGYLLRARRTDAWDAIITLLVTLEIEQHDFFHAVMQGCRPLSNSRPEIDGLDDLLTAPEQHLHDVALEREHRRSQQGYATPADARAFLQMARQPRTTTAMSPIAAAYFRATEGEAASTGTLELAQHPDETAYRTRGRQLAFLANTLLAGCSVQSRPFTPREAADAAAAICKLGRESMTPPSAHLLDHDLVRAFEIGWSVLHQDVSVFVADRLISILAGLRCHDADIRRELRAFERELVKQRQAATPWLARDAADVLAMLDMTAWVSVRGLLDECPILPAALTAVLERSTASVSPIAFEFISTTAQIGDIRLFMRTLPDVLSS